MLDVAAAKAGQPAERALRGNRGLAEGGADRRVRDQCRRRQLQRAEAAEDGRRQGAGCARLHAVPEDLARRREVWFSHKLSDAVSAWSADGELRPLDTRVMVQCLRYKSRAAACPSARRALAYPPGRVSCYALGDWGAWGDRSRVTLAAAASVVSHSTPCERRSSRRLGFRRIRPIAGSAPSSSRTPPCHPNVDLITSGEIAPPT